MPQITIQFLIFSSLALLIGFLALRPARFLRIPHSSGLVILGLFAGIFFQNEIRNLAPWLPTRFGEILVNLLLPILIFESAYQMDLEQLKKDLLPIGTLAFLGLGISTILVGLAVHYLMWIPLTSALLFGALISATDPVAVLALFKEVRAPKRLIYLVEGESLANDATAIILFRALLGLSENPGLPVWSITGLLVVKILVSGFGAVVVGYISSLMLQILLRWNIHFASAQLGTTLCWTYLTYFACEYGFGISGILAVIVLGIVVGKKKETLHSDAQHAMLPMWELLALIANSLIFLAVGLISDLSALLQAWPIALAILLIVGLARALSIIGTVPVLNLFPRLAEPIRRAYQVILFWGGLRGGLSLALVLSLPNTLPAKNIFIVFTLSVVLATNLFNAITTPWVLRYLRLDGAQST